MILVTVGTGKFDSLIESVDKLVKEKKIMQKVILQTGQGKYVPKNTEYFDFKRDLDKLIEKSDLIITHGGAGTLFECLRKNKKLIGVANPEKTGNHQTELLEELENQKYLLWCKDLNNLDEEIKKSKSFKFKKYIKPKNEIEKVVKEFLSKKVLS